MYRAHFVLHMAHAWASRQPDLKADILGKLTFAEASGDGGEAAWNAILEGKKIEIRSSPVDGNQQQFMDVVKNMLSALESRKELTIGREILLGAAGWDGEVCLDWTLSTL